MTRTAYLRPWVFKSSLSVTLTALVLNGLLAGCASEAKRRSEQNMIVVDKKSDRQIVAEFDGLCAMALAQGKIKLGNEKYVLQHDGKTYYFASAEAKRKFERNLEQNLENANNFWHNRMNMG